MGKFHPGSWEKGGSWGTEGKMNLPRLQTGLFFLEVEKNNPLKPAVFQFGTGRHKLFLNKEKDDLNASISQQVLVLTLIKCFH